MTAHTTFAGESKWEGNFPPVFSLFPTLSLENSLAFLLYLLPLRALTLKALSLRRPHINGGDSQESRAFPEKIQATAAVGHQTLVVAHAFDPPNLDPSPINSPDLAEF